MHIARRDPSAVDLPPVTDAHHVNEENLVQHFIKDVVVAHTNVIHASFAGKCDACRGPGVIGKKFDGGAGLSDMQVPVNAGRAVVHALAK